MVRVALAVDAAKRVVVAVAFFAVVADLVVAGSFLDFWVRFEQQLLELLGFELVLG